MKRIQPSLYLFVARHLLPRKLVYWAAIVVGSEATTGKWSGQVVPELTFIDAIERFSLEGR